jgi:hypothetical protein
MRTSNGPIEKGAHRLRVLVDELGAPKRVAFEFGVLAAR